MAITCKYTLNGMEFSILHCIGVGSFPAFSGQKYGRNNPTKQDLPSIGPIPIGNYYIVGRQSGGRLGWLKLAFLSEVYGTDRSEWFGLYRDDDKIDDDTFINGIKRGAFRIHPRGPQALSEGCLTLMHHSDFQYLRNALLNTSMISIPGSGLKAYGTVIIN